MRRSGRGFGPKLDLFVLVLVVGAIGVVVWIGMAFWNATRVDVAATGIDDGRALTPEAAAALDVTIDFATGEELYRADLTVDGVPVLEDVELPEDATSVQVRPQELVDDEIVEHALDGGRAPHRAGRQPAVPRRLHLRLDLRRRQRRPHPRGAAGARPGADRRAGHHHGRGRGGRRPVPRRRARGGGRRSLRGRLRQPADRLSRLRRRRRGRQPHRQERGRARRLPVELPGRPRERRRRGPTRSSGPTSRASSTAA